MKISIVAFVIFISLSAGHVAQSIYADAPVYISKLPITEYTLFANGGWDGNWYIGYNQAWIEKLQINHNKNNFARAFIGAKIGRMKTTPKSGRPAWIREALKGSVNIAVSSSPIWQQHTRKILTTTNEIPFEYDYENAFVGVGESRWFWVEYPLELINFSGDNFVAIWSDDKFMTTVSSAPILAAGWGNQETDTWLCPNIHEIEFGMKGDPLKTPLTVFEPAIAIKLIPKNATRSITPVVLSMETSTIKPNAPQTMIKAAINEGNIEKAFIETSANKKDWKRVSRTLYNPPYFFSIDNSELPTGIFYFRVTARDILGNVGYSESFEVKSQIADDRREKPSRPRRK